MTTLTRASLEDAFKGDDNRKSQTIDDIAADLTKGTYDIGKFVEELGFGLTSPELDKRVHSTELLSGVLAKLPKDLLNEMQLDFISTFYADRLKDHHNVIPAVIVGIDALIRMQHLSNDCVVRVLQSFFHHTTCQSQVRSDRAKLFEIFKYLSEHYAEALKSMSGDFIYGLINSIDGERDPRNLDFIFTFMPSFIANFPLLHLSEEMFEIFACYFPIDFNPSKNDPDTITRDRLAEKLTQCLVASADFIEWTVALALEKLESELLVAKLDSLELLTQAALKFPPKLLEPHFEQIWSALKTEIFPGSDNTDVKSAGLRTLSALLEQAASVPTTSHNYQTVILGHILPHLGEVNQRLFSPATAIALVCISGDVAYATDKVLNSFLLTLQKQQQDQVDVAQRLKIYSIIAQAFKIAEIRCGPTLAQIRGETCTALLDDVIASLTSENVDLKPAALSVLNESVPLLSDAQRVLLYKSLVQLITQPGTDLPCSMLLEQLGALYPIELQSNCIDVFVRNFTLYDNFAKGKVYRNLLPLIKQLAFTDRVLDLILSNVLKGNVNAEIRLLALEALNSLLRSEEAHFVEQLQEQNCLIDKLIKLAKEQEPTPANDFTLLEQIAAALSLIMQHLAIPEQYTIACEYLPQLQLQLAADLYVAKGLLGFLHKDISLDDHFERLVQDLTQLSLQSDNEELRKVAHQLLCSLINKIADTPENRSAFAKIISKLKEEIKKGDERAVEALAWLGKGLIVRGYDEAGDIIEALSALLDHPSLSTAAELAFEIISAEYPQLHLPVVKFLFKQKFFHMVLGKLGQKLETYCTQHLNAFMYVLQGTPHAVLKMNIEKVGPVLFKGLESQHTHTLQIALKICEHFVKAQDEYFRSHLNHIIPSCLQLTSFKSAMQVRIAALQLLDDLTKYPTFVLLPYKMDVVLHLAAALDDPKRLVRNAAVTARNAWYLIGAVTPTNES